MDTSRMELSMEQMRQVTGADCILDTSCPHGCSHPNKVKTPWWGREDDFLIFWSQHQNAYLCPDCHKVVWIDEDP